MEIKLTELQVWFLKKAIIHKDWVLPLHKDTLDDKDFKLVYGVTKKKVNKEIDELNNQLINL